MRHNDFFNYSHVYGLYPIVTEQILCAFECLKCSKGEVIAEAQRSIGPYRGDYVILVVKKKRNKDIIEIPILLIEVKFGVSGGIDTVSPSHLTEMFLYVKYIFEEYTEIGQIYCALTDGTNGHAFLVQNKEGKLSAIEYFTLKNNLCRVIGKGLKLH